MTILFHCPLPSRLHSYSIDHSPSGERLRRAALTVLRRNGPKVEPLTARRHCQRLLRRPVAHVEGV